MASITRRSMLALGLGAAALLGLRAPRAAAAVGEETERAKGVKQRILGEGPSLIPGYSKVSMRDMIFEPGATMPASLVSPNRGIRLANLFQYPRLTFLLGIFQALDVRRSGIRGEIFGCSGFANSIRSFLRPREQLTNSESLCPAIEVAHFPLHRCHTSSRVHPGLISLMAQNSLTHGSSTLRKPLAFRRAEAYDSSKRPK
jgi:hypothetical protein